MGLWRDAQTLGGPLRHPLAWTGLGLPGSNPGPLSSSVSSDEQILLMLNVTCQARRLSPARCARSLRTSAVRAPSAFPVVHPATGNKSARRSRTKFDLALR